MNEMLFNLLLTILSIVLTVLGAYATAFVRDKLNQLKLNNDFSHMSALIDKVNSIVAMCVDTTTQTYVQSLKESGNFTIDAQKEAFKKTFDSICNILTKEDKDSLCTYVGDINLWLTNSIEAYIQSNK